MQTTKKDNALIEHYLNVIKEQERLLQVKERELRVVTSLYLECMGNTFSRK
jgi:hypothetical protein